MTPDADVGIGAGVAGVVLLEVDGFSVEVALRLPFATVALGVAFFSGAL